MIITIKGYIQILKGVKHTTTNVMGIKCGVASSLRIKQNKRK